MESRQTAYPADRFEELDPGIREAVRILREADIETFESCQGGPGHCFPEPTIRFHGNHVEGFRAYAVAMTMGLPVLTLRRVFDVIDGELTGPKWELVFRADPAHGYVNRAQCEQSGRPPVPGRL